MVSAGLDFYSKFGTELMQLIKKDVKLCSILFCDQIPQNAMELAEQLYRSFKPHPDMANNLVHHIRTEAQMRTLETLVDQDLAYRDVYRKLCISKYGGYFPNSYKMIDESVENYTEQLKRLRSKRYVYRGYDNIRVLQ